MLIQHQHTGNKGMFFVPGEDENYLAELSYAMQGNENMILEHTEVSDELRGQNVGYQLVHAAVEYARTHHHKILPVCPFARSVIEKKPEFRDIIAAN